MSISETGRKRTPPASLAANRRMRVMVIFGTRPEAIKMAPVVRELERRKKDFKLRICVTAQHREMLEQVTQLFHMPVHYDLDVMRPNQTLCGLTGRIMERLPKVLDAERPDAILVQGDTTTTFAASLAAFYKRIAVGHIEAGLRTSNRFSPYPEEINRRLTTQLTDFHFAPTAWARQNLLNDGVLPGRVFVTGNTVIDALYQARGMVRRRPPNFPELNGFDRRKRRLILVTAHRRENFGAGLIGICEALRRLATARDDIEIVYAVHLNPQVRGPVLKQLSRLERVHLIPPQDYLRFVWLMTQAYLVLTDSGGIQEEMPAFGIPVLVMRDTTERPEGVEAGVCKLVGTNPDVIERAVTELLEDQEAYRSCARRTNPFGDGKAAPRIVKHLLRLLRDSLGS
jgi:UDP-N-acetylglucosamine 2-epimerase (non-hydrolysing)